MNDDLLMDLADVGSVDGLLGVIHRHHPDWTGEVPVERLAADVGITEIGELKTDGFVGALVTNAEKSEGAILVRTGDRPPRRRFTIAHELGHFLIPSHTGNRQCTRKDMSETRAKTLHQKQESQANTFAAGLLMPKKRFTRNMDALGSPDVSHLFQLARDFGTSLEATANRYVDLTETACAIVMSKNGLVRYARRSTRFPWLDVRSNEPLPQECATLLSPATAPRTPSSWSTVNGTVWLEAEHGTRPPTLLEQSMYQAKGYCVTLLFIEDDEFSEGDDEDADDGECRELRFR